MSNRMVWFMVLTALVGSVPPSPDGLGAQETGAAPPPRAIPGITVQDAFPRGCVDCHRNYPEQGMDVRISTLMAQWTRGVVDSTLLARARLTVPPGVSITGKHPPLKGALKDIPNGCLDCHGKDADGAPPFARLIHLIHLTGGAENHFLTTFQGECTHCHKLDSTAGVWSIPSGSEG